MTSADERKLSFLPGASSGWKINQQFSTDEILSICSRGLVTCLVSGHYSTRLGIVFMTCQHHCHVRVTCGPHAAVQMLNPNEAPARTGNPAQTTENLVRAPASSTCNEHLYYTCFFRVPEKILRRRRYHPEEAGASSGCPINLEKKVSSAQGLTFRDYDNYLTNILEVKVLRALNFSNFQPPPLRKQSPP